MDIEEDHAERVALACVMRSERGRLDISQIVLGERSGLSKSTIVRLEAGVRGADFHQMIALARVFGGSASWLMGRVETEMARAEEVQIPIGQQAKLDQLSAKLTQSEINRAKGRTRTGDS